MEEGSRQHNITSGNTNFLNWITNKTGLDLFFIKYSGDPNSQDNVVWEVSRCSVTMSAKPTIYPSYHACPLESFECVRTFNANNVPTNNKQHTRTHCWHWPAWPPTCPLQACRISSNPRPLPMPYNCALFRASLLLSFYIPLLKGKPVRPFCAVSQVRMRLCRIAIMQLLLNCYAKKLVLLLRRILLLSTCRLLVVRQTNCTSTICLVLKCDPN